MILMHLYLKRDNCFKFIHHKMTLSTISNCYSTLLFLLMLTLHLCINCFQSFINKEELAKHWKVCLEINIKDSVEMLEIGSKVNFHKQLQVLFVIYTNFKTITQGVGSHDRDNDIDDKSYTNIFQKHLVCRYVYKVLEKDLERFKSLFRSFKDLENMNEKVLKEVEF